MTTLDTVLNACGSVIFSFLTIHETSLSASASQTFLSQSRLETTRRFESWLLTTSKSWASYDRNLPNRHQSFLSADDLPLSSAHALSGLDMVWRNAFSTPSHLLSAVAAWCCCCCCGTEGNTGGRPAEFLASRERGAKPQPTITRGRPVHFTTIGEEYPPLISDDRRIVLLFDMHCDGTPVWNAVCPVNESDLGTLVAEDGDGEEVEVSVFHPISSWTLGDATDEATIHPFDHAFRPAVYLLSTDVDDKRTWRFDVSMVSRVCLETLIHSYSIVPAEQKGLIDEYGGWESYHQQVGGSERREEGDDLSPPPAARSRVQNLFRCSDLPDVTRSRAPPLKGVGVDGNVMTFDDLVYFDLCYWLDERDAKRHRLHLTLDFSCPDTLFSNMIMRAPRTTRSGVTTDSCGGEEESAKKRHRSV